MDGYGRILLTQRHPDKHYQLYWECSGGSVLTDESPDDAAVRELFEETGIEAEISELVQLDIIFGNHAIYYNYLLQRDIELSSLLLQENEVVDAKFADKSEYDKMKSEKSIVPPVVERFEKLGIDRLLKTLN
ncbi:MAG: NUDIX domain-containing protein [Ruminiclostridium sp.]|nr:NUDIX domain-containing protein [Ruminiclostridium sp.]